MTFRENVFDINQAEVRIKKNYGINLMSEQSYSSLINCFKCTLKCGNIIFKNLTIFFIDLKSNYYFSLENSYFTEISNGYSLISVVHHEKDMPITINLINSTFSNINLKSNNGSVIKFFLN